jgi:hypothetical protein
MRIILVIALYCIPFLAFSQSNIRFQNSYFLTGQPIFGVGYEHETTRPYTLGIHFEVGQYAALNQDLISATRQDYSLGGVSVYPEFRLYLNKAYLEGNHRGLFFGAFGQLARLREYNISPQYEQGQNRKGLAAGIGISSGMRIDTEQSPFYFEVLVGAGKSAVHWAEPLAWDDAKKRAAAENRDSKIYRLELAIGYRLKQ